MAGLEVRQEHDAASARKSKNPRCRLGAVIVRDNLLSTASTGSRARFFDDPALLADPDEKLKLICHAEQDGIHNAARPGVALEGDLHGLGARGTPENGRDLDELRVASPALRITRFRRSRMPRACFLVVVGVAGE